MSYLPNRKKGTEGWLLFFYSVPAKPVSSRMKIWRRLSKAGAVQLKGAVYVLPVSEEHHEFFQWLVAEVTGMGGDAAFVRVSSIEPMNEADIVDMFNANREKDYEAISKTLNELETRLNSIKKGSGAQNLKLISDRLDRAAKGFEETQKTDFFSSKTGADIRSRINALKITSKGLSGTAPDKTPDSIPSRKIEDFQGKIWTTRKRPFVDRMASAWLIRRFIDKKASFRLRNEKDIPAMPGGQVTFDLSGGMFTHTGNLCTFEVLVKAFNLKDRTVRKMSEIVHELDIKDDRFRNPETHGIEQILLGLRKSVSDDMELLEKGMSVFEMLYMSKTINTA